MMLLGLHWKDPLWLLALLPLSLLFFLLYRRHTSHSIWEKTCDAHLLPHLDFFQPTRRAHPLLWLGVSWFLACIALAGPALNKTITPLYKSPYARLFVLDLSNQMNAQDILPSRLTRARFKLIDMLRNSQSNPVGLVVFAKEAYVVSPLTQDANTITAVIPQLTPDLMPAQGHAIDQGLKKALNLLHQGKATQGQIILITTGNISTAAMHIAQEIKKAGFQLDVLGVGSTQGAPVSNHSTDFETTQHSTLFSQLNTPRLKQLARTGGGHYMTLRTTASTDIKALLQTPHSDNHQHRSTQEAHDWHNLGPYLCLIILFLSLIAFRPHRINPSLIFLFAFFLPSTAFSFTVPTPLLNKNQQAMRLLDQRKPLKAAHLFNTPLWKGYAYYRAKKYKKALQSFQHVSSALSYYNQGNAYAQLGAYEKSIQAYQTALKKNPHNHDAKFNLELIKKLLQDQQKQDQQKQDQQKQDQQRQDQQKQDQQKQDQQKQDQQRQDQQKQDQQRQDQQKQDQQKQDQQKQKKKINKDNTSSKQRLSPAQKQELENWLRSIPDDSTGLLERDFMYQHQKLIKETQ